MNLALTLIQHFLLVESVVEIINSSWRNTEWNNVISTEAAYGNPSHATGNDDSGLWLYTHG